MESEIIKMRRLKRQLESTVLDILNIHNKSYIRSDDIDECGYCPSSAVEV
jgi:hypothetical protein